MGSDWSARTRGVGDGAGDGAGDWVGDGVGDGVCNWWATEQVIVRGNRVGDGAAMGWVTARARARAQVWLNAYTRTYTDARTN